MYFVYILRSRKERSRLYIGCTNSLLRRIKEHNSEENEKTYSSRYKPWELECYFGFKTQQVAEDFESYLKEGSGFAFMKKHLLSKRV